MTINFKINNITCEACVKISSMALKNLLGVKKVQIEKDGMATIESDRDIAWDEIKNVLAQADKQAILIK